MKKYIDVLQTDKWKIKLQGNETFINFKIDTGAEVNVIPVKVYNTIKPKNTLTKTTITLTAYNSTKIPILGSCMLQLQNKGIKINAQFIVADTNANAVISANTAENLGLLQRIHAINKTDLEALIGRYKDFFGDLGKLPVTQQITINPDIKPVINPPRNIPFGMKPK